MIPYAGTPKQRKRRPLKVKDHKQFTVHLETNTYLKLSEEATQRGASMGHVLREALAAGFPLIQRQRCVEELQTSPPSAASEAYSQPLCLLLVTPPRQLEASTSS